MGQFSLLLPIGVLTHPSLNLSPTDIETGHTGYILVVRRLCWQCSVSMDDRSRCSEVWVLHCSNIVNKDSVTCDGVNKSKHIQDGHIGSNQMNMALVGSSACYCSRGGGIHSSAHSCSLCSGNIPTLKTNERLSSSWLVSRKLNIAVIQRRTLHCSGTRHHWCKMGSLGVSHLSWPAPNLCPCSTTPQITPPGQQPPLCLSSSMNALLSERPPKPPHPTSTDLKPALHPVYYLSCWLAGHSHLLSGGFWQCDVASLHLPEITCKSAVCHPFF